MNDFQELPGVPNLLGHLLINVGRLGYEFRNVLESHDGYTDGYAYTESNEQIYL